MKKLACLLKHNWWTFKVVKEGLSEYAIFRICRRCKKVQRSYTEGFWNRDFQSHVGCPGLGCTAEESLRYLLGGDSIHGRFVVYNDKIPRKKFSEENVTPISEVLDLIA